MFGPVLMAAALVAACATETIPDAVTPPSPERMADGVSRAESLAVIEQLGGWPPSAAPAPPPQCPPVGPSQLVDAAALNARLDSLERVILVSDDARRIDAVARFGNSGLMSSLEQLCVETTPPDVRIPGIVARLAGLYAQVDDYQARSLIILLMINQAERAEAVSFLERVARGGEGSRLGKRALDALSRMGREGETALHRLRTP